MAGWASFDLADDILDFVYRGIPISIGANVYLRLLVEPSSRSGGGTETNYNGYARLALLRAASGIWANSPSSGRLTNAIELAIGTDANSVGNGPLVAFDIVDTPSGAFTKLYNGGPILTPKLVVLGKTVKFRAGALLITF